MNITIHLTDEEAAAVSDWRSQPHGHRAEESTAGQIRALAKLADALGEQFTAGDHVALRDTTGTATGIVQAVVKDRAWVAWDYGNGITHHGILLTTALRHTDTNR